MHGPSEGCAIELDAAPAGKTNAQGELVLTGVDPTDHYIHVLCPGRHELAYYVSPHPGEILMAAACCLALCLVVVILKGLNRQPAVVFQEKPRG